MYGQEALRFYDAATGSIAMQMDRAIVTQWLPAVPGKPMSLHLHTPAGVTGRWTVEGTNFPEAGAAPAAAALVSGATIPESSYYQEASQPAGSEVDTLIPFLSPALLVRAVFTPSSGGSGILPVGYVAYGAGA